MSIRQSQAMRNEQQHPYKMRDSSDEDSVTQGSSNSGFPLVELDTHSSRKSWENESMSTLRPHLSHSSGPGLNILLHRIINHV